MSKAKSDMARRMIEAQFGPAYPYKVDANDATRKGQPAGKKFLFGPHKRYAVQPLHSRFGEITWFVWDAEVAGEPEVIRQEPSFDAAVLGLMTPHENLYKKRSS
jgi:hypothetical protein